MIEVNVSIAFKGGVAFDDVIAYGEKLATVVEERFTSARLGDTGTGFEEQGYVRDLHFEVESTDEGCELLGVLVPRLLNDGYTVTPERPDGLVRDENEMDDDRLTIYGTVQPGFARVGIIVFADAEDRQTVG